MTQLFDFDNALKALQNGQALIGKDGILTPLIKQLTESALAAELDSYSPMMLKLTVGMALRKRPLKHQPVFELATPRDRNGSFNHNW